MALEFDWDDKKAASNLRKHGVSFEDAIGVFGDRRAVTIDGQTVGTERRLKTTGYADEYAMLTVVHTLRKIGGVDFIRVISARAASRRERRTYGDRSIQSQTPDPGTDRPA